MVLIVPFTAFGMFGLTKYVLFGGSKVILDVLH